MRGEATAPPIVQRLRELRRHQRWAFVMAVAALAVGAALLPRGDELLLIHVRNHDLGRARQVLANGPAHGISSAASVSAHGELFLFEGRVDEALTEMEGYVDAHPNESAAWKRLSRLYENAQRLHDQIRALTQVYRLAPSEAIARQLATLHRWTGDEAGEASVLQDLVASDGASADEHLRCARLEAALGRRPQASDVLERFRSRDPRLFDYAAMELYASLLLDEGRGSLLAARLQPMPLVQEDPEMLGRLAAALRGWGRADAAVALFDVPPGRQPVPAFLAMRARAAEGTGEARRVVDELGALDTTSALAPEPLHAFVQLALSIKDYDLVERVLRNPRRVADPALVAIAIGHAVSHDARDRAQSLVTSLGDDSLIDSPMLALELAVERSDRAGAEGWIAAVDAGGAATGEQIAALAQFESRLGLTDRAFDRLLALARSGHAPAWALTDLTTLAPQVARADEALRVLESLSSRSAEARPAWARLAVDADRTGAIEAWFSAGPPAKADAPALRDLYFLLSERGNTSLAIVAAERLVAATGAPDEALLLGQALLGADRPFEALVPLRQTRSDRTEARVAYDTALYSALLAGHDVAEELRAVFPGRLLDDELPESHRAVLVEGLWAAGERASLADDLLSLAAHDPDRWLSALVESARAAGRHGPAIALVADTLDTARDGKRPAGQRRENFVHALMDLDAPNGVLLPYLESLAYTAGGGWVHAYDERLAQVESATSERIALWSRVGASTEVPTPERRAAASRLVELGATSRATAVIQDLAAVAGPSDPDVLQLVYLWGPRADTGQLAWLRQRLQGASSEDQPKWIAHMVGAGGASLVVETLPDLPDAAPPSLVDAWVDAHRATSDRQHLARALERVLTREDAGTAQIRHAGRVALAEGMTDYAVRAFRAVASREPEDRESMRWLGTLAFYDGRTAEARAQLAAYAAAGGVEPEPLYQLGELALGRQDTARAERHFTQALAQLADADAAAANQTLLANILVRLGKRPRAMATFESILDANPGLDHVRADYAAALIQWGDYDRARTVLLLTSGASEAGPTDAGGARRLDLLRVQWLNVHGQYPEALRLIEDLALRHPSDPDVLLARGRFDTERGRLAEADRDYEAARAMAPQRDDVVRLLDDLARERAPRAALQTDTRSISDGWDERATRISVQGRSQLQAPLSLSVERLHLRAPRVVRTDGSTAPLDVDLSRFEAGASMPVAAGTTVAGVVFGTSGGAGAGLTLTRHDLRGSTIVAAEFGRPFWEFLESAADDGRKDRVGVQRQWRFRADLAAWVLADLNRYRLASGASLSSTALGFGIVRTVRSQWPTLTLQYGLDKEHRLSRTILTTPAGQPFRPIPLSSREVHLFGAISRFQAFDIWEVEATGGYTVDRLGGRGSFVTGRMTPRPSARAGVELWAERRLYTIATTQQVFRSGARLTVRF